MKLNIGAGNKSMDGWTSLGLEDHHEIQSDIRRLAVPDNRVTEALACHVVEHIAIAEVPAMLTDWFRAMAPGATLAIEGPDLVKCCRNVLADPENEQMGINGIYGDLTSEDPLLRHRWGMTVATLKRMLSEAGFIKMREEVPQFHGRRVSRDLRLVAMKPHA